MLKLIEQAKEFFGIADTGMMSLTWLKNRSYEISNMTIHSPSVKCDKGWDNYIYIDHIAINYLRSVFDYLWEE